MQPHEIQINAQIQKILVKDHVRTICQTRPKANRFKARPNKSCRNRSNSKSLSSKKVKVFAQCHSNNQDVSNSTFEKVSTNSNKIDRI